MSASDCELQSRAPSEALKPLVRAYAQRKGTWAGAGFSQATPASLECIIDFEFGDCPTVGYRAEHAACEHGHLYTLSVQLRPRSAALHILGQEDNAWPKWARSVRRSARCCVSIGSRRAFRRRLRPNAPGSVSRLLEH